MNANNIEDGVYYIQEYGIEKVGDIGLDLGLSFATLRSLSSEKFREEAIEAWLQKKDKVEERSGAPTWVDCCKEWAVLKLQRRSQKVASQIFLWSNTDSFITIDNTMLEMAKLTHVQWNVGNTKDEIKVVDEACPNWDTIGVLIGMSHNKTQAIEKERSTIKKRFEEVLHH